MVETIADAIRSTLERLGQSQQEAADIIGVSQPTLNRWASGVSVPSEPQIAAIAKWS